MSEKYEQEYSSIAEEMKMCAGLRFRDIITETINEQSRMKNFCRIFPGKNSKLYDKYFSN